MIAASAKARRMEERRLYMVLRNEFVNASMFKTNEIARVTKNRILESYFIFGAAGFWWYIVEAVMSTIGVKGRLRAWSQRDRLFMNSKQKSKIKLLCGVWWNWRMRLGIATVHEAQTYSPLFGAFRNEAKDRLPDGGSPPFKRFFASLRMTNYETDPLTNHGCG